MVKSLRVIAAAVALMAMLVCSASVAQEPPPPEPRNGSSSGQFSQMREKYKYTFQLMSMAHHIGEINKDPKYALTQTQARKVLAVLQPLRSKPKLTQDQAKEALKKLKPVFTTTQLNAMAKIKPRRPGQGQPGAGQGRPGGPPPGGDRAGRPRFDPNAMKDFNPFYAKAAKGDEFAARRAARWNDFFKALDSRAKGIKTAPAKTVKPLAKKAPAKK